MITIEVQSWPNEMGFWAERRLSLSYDGITQSMEHLCTVEDAATWLGRALAKLGHPVRAVNLPLEDEIIAEITAVADHAPGSAAWKETLALEIVTEESGCETCGAHIDQTLTLSRMFEGQILSLFESGHMQASNVRRMWAAEIWKALTQLGYEVSIFHLRMAAPAK